MNDCLEPIDKLLDGIEDTERELSFALGFTDGPLGPNELRWLAAVAAKRAQELEDLEDQS